MTHKEAADAHERAADAIVANAANANELAEAAEQAALQALSGVTAKEKIEFHRQAWNAHMLLATRPNDKW